MHAGCDGQRVGAGRSRGSRRGRAVVGAVPREKPDESATRSNGGLSQVDIPSDSAQRWVSNGPFPAPRPCRNGPKGTHWRLWVPNGPSGGQKRGRGVPNGTHHCQPWVPNWPFAAPHPCRNGPNDTHYRSWVPNGPFPVRFCPQGVPNGTHYQHWVPNGPFGPRNRVTNVPNGTHPKRWVPNGQFSRQNHGQSGPNGTHCQRWVINAICGGRFSVRFRHGRPAVGPPSNPAAGEVARVERLATDCAL